MSYSTESQAQAPTLLIELSSNPSMSADMLSLGQCSISLGVWQHEYPLCPSLPLCL